MEVAHHIHQPSGRQERVHASSLFKQSLVRIHHHHSVLAPANAFIQEVGQRLQGKFPGFRPHSFQAETSLLLYIRRIIP